MANLTEVIQYPAGIYQIETTDPVLGGPGGIANRQAQNLANRTAYLKQHLDALEDGSFVPNGIATQNFARGLLNQLDYKQSVRAATTANITLSGAQTVDGVSLLVGDRVLVKNQTSGAQNGIYIVSGSVWARAIDADEAAEINAGLTVYVEEGSANALTRWQLTTTGAITVGVSTLTFQKASGMQFSNVRQMDLSVTNVALTPADIGSLIVFSGSGGGTLTLPKANTVPAGSCITIRANNTTVSTNVVAAASGDTLTGALQSTAPAGTLRSGDSVMVVSDGASTWHVTADATYNFTSQAVARWFGANQSLADIGYQKLPGTSGLIMQWGVAPTTTTSSDVTFPTAFPTKCTYVGTHDQGAAGTTSMSIFQVAGLTKTGFTAVNIAAFTRGQTTVNAPTNAGRPWLAIGY